MPREVTWKAVKLKWDRSPSNEVVGKAAAGGIEAPVSEQDPRQGAASRRAQRRAQGDAEQDSTQEPEATEPPVRSGREILDRNQRVREQAARKRDASRQAKGRPSGATGLDASEMVDDALTRGTHATVSFARRHFNVVQWVVLGGVAVAIGAHLYSHRREGQIQTASDVLAKALHTENGRIGDTGDRGADKNSGLADVQPSFPTDTDRLKAASRAYEEAKTQAVGKGGALLATMGLAGVAFEKQNLAEAARLYAEVKNSELAGQDNELKGRALLGISAAKEGLKDLEGALAPLRELENMGVARFTPVAQYHQARILYGRGEAEKAKPLLEKALKKLESDKPSSAEPFAPPTELESSVRALLQLIDPTRAEAPASGMTPEQLARLRAQLEAMGKNPKGPSPTPSSPEK